jgi:ubiquinone/menaquinone biosynthesis C-methylase UbiE
VQVFREFYEDKLLPHFINCACGNRAIARQRGKVVPLAQGRVLEVGMGPGLNLPFYDPARVQMVWGLEPCHGMRSLAQPRIDEAPFPVTWLDLPGEEIPLEDASVDTVLLTYTLCTIPDWRRALEGMRRVLKPGGKLVFCEHGLAPDPGVRRWQNRLDPLWQKIAGGCHVNRPIAELLQAGGFAVAGVHNEYVARTPRFLGYHYLGTATRA